MDYTLRLPFRLAPGRTISGIVPSPQVIGGCPVVLRESAPYLVLEARGFPTRQAALAFIEVLRLGLAWAALECGLAYTAELQPDEVIYAPDPIAAAKAMGLSGPVDGLVNGNVPCAYPSDKHVRFAMLGEPTLNAETSATRLLGVMAEGASAGSVATLQDSRVSTSLALYCLAFHERSPNARFLAFVMGLEALATRIARPSEVLQHIKRWQNEIADRKILLDTDSDEYAALESLERELLFRTESSLRSSIRRLVYETLSTENALEARSLSRSAVKAYDARGKLVHDGWLESRLLSECSRDVEMILRRVLRARLSQGTPGN